MGYHEDDTQAYLSWLDAKENPDRHTDPIDGCQYDVEEMVRDVNQVEPTYIFIENIDRYLLSYYPKEEREDVKQELLKQVK